MNQGQSYNLESLFGPQSEPIDITKFLEGAKSAHSTCSNNGEQIRHGIEEECSVDDIKTTLATTWSDPLLSATLIKDHTHTVGVLSSGGNTRSSKASRNSQLTSQSSSEDVVALQKEIQAISLSSWRLNADAVHFMRTPKNSDFNILQQPKSYGEIDNIDPSTAVLSVSVYNRIPWGPSYVTRLSQHALLSSQTLGHLFNILPCVYKALPNQPTANEDGSFMCIEGIVYGDGTAETDYATKLIAHLDAFKRNAKSVRKASTPLNTTAMSSLTLRLNEPYWLVHQGNCEHFIVIDQIRLLHVSDRRSGFPLTLQITPPLLDLCRSCQRVPAVASIVGDIRLGESPCVLCAPCWKQMGELGHDTDVLVRPLPNYKVTQ